VSAAPDFLSFHAQSHPDKPAAILDDSVTTFKELDAAATRHANLLLRLGVSPGDRMAAMAFNSIEGFVIGNGNRRAGAVGVPVNFRLRGSEIAYVLNDSGARGIVAGPEMVPLVEAARPDITGEVFYIAMDGDAPQAWLSYPDLMAAAPTDRPEGVEEGTSGIGATMIYTSGTTGHPKGAYRPQGVKPETVLEAIQLFELSNSDVHLMVGPGYHSAVGLFASLHQVMGATVVIQRKFDPEGALRLIERRKVTNIYMAPTLLKRLCDLPEEALASADTSSLRAIILGAAPCPYALKERAVRLFGEVLWEFYGATETGVNTILRPEDQLRKPGSCGQASPGHEIRLLDEEGVEVPVGQPGIVWVRNSVLAEYFGKPDATRANLQDGFFTVGDIAYRDDEGYYYICDRMVDMIISGGVNIYPAEIEAALHAHPAVRDAAVIGVPDDQWGESVKAVVSLHPGTDVAESELIEFCRGRLADYKKPKSVDFVDELPRDAAGKLLKRVIREPYWAGAGRRI
jgi:fatty-acyl-CoA synthase/long-chain acyl-CoA synthetase